jgi:hypothetical protein
VSPILVRPVREQLEHDRVIRILQAKFRRRFDVGVNPGNEQNATVAPLGLYPDLVLLAQDRGRRPQAVIEVETGESVNHLEALAEWSHFSKLRVPFHLYVPSGMVEVARRLCGDNGIIANEIWSYHGVGDELRFTLVHRTRDAHPERAAGSTAAASRKALAAKRARGRARPTGRPARAARPRAAARTRGKASKTAKKAVRGQRRK